MSQLVARPAHPIARFFGSRGRWSRDGALVGAVTGYGGTALGLTGLSMHPWLVGAGLAGALAGALLGYIAPNVLNTLRRHVPLPLLVLAFPFVAASIAASIGVAAATVVGAPVAVAAKFAAVAAAAQVAVFWLPYTVAAVMKLPRWPVLAGALLVAPLTGPLAKWVVISLL